MQDDLASAYPTLEITVLGINELGQESANALAVAGHDLPWMQDGDQNANDLSDVWHEAWQAEWRDVVVLNGANEKTFVYNLTTYNLANAANYQTLRDAMLKTAIQDQRPWCNAENYLDVDRNGIIQLSDFELVLGFLNSSGPQNLSPTAPPTAHIDCDFDGFASPIDALRVINHLNSQILEGEGEPLELEPMFWQSPAWPVPEVFTARPEEVDAVLFELGSAPSIAKSQATSDTSLAPRKDLTFTLPELPEAYAITFATGGEGLNFVVLIREQRLVTSLLGFSIEQPEPAMAN